MKLTRCMMESMRTVALAVGFSVGVGAGVADAQQEMSAMKHEGGMPMPNQGMGLG